MISKEKIRKAILNITENDSNESIKEFRETLSLIAFQKLEEKKHEISSSYFMNEQEDCQET